MHYFVGVIFLIIVFIAVPGIYLAFIAAYLVFAALVVKLSAKLITDTEPPLSSCVKAVIYSLIFGVIAMLVGFQVLATGSPWAALVLPAALVLSQTFAYSAALSITMLHGFVVSIGVTAIAWMTIYLLGFSALLALKAAT